MQSTQWLLVGEDTVVTGRRKETAAVVTGQRRYRAHSTEKTALVVEENRAADWSEKRKEHVNWLEKRMENTDWSEKKTEHVEKRGQHVERGEDHAERREQ
ncbi:hypothetical protein RJT34_02860 [Clitoria ternatea]|uniref:Uncharacterized protein n=1 Tax=Clitoria ternatea TaxID=43366 RepID=A0AAN9KKM0_CLITE